MTKKKGTDNKKPTPICRYFELKTLPCRCCSSRRRLSIAALSFKSSGISTLYIPELLSTKKRNNQPTIIITHAHCHDNMCRLSDLCSTECTYNYLRIINIRK